MLNKTSVSERQFIKILINIDMCNKNLKKSVCVSDGCVCILLRGAHKSTKTNRGREKTSIEIISSWSTGRSENTITLLKTFIGQSTALSERIMAASQITLPEWLPPSSCWQSTCSLSLSDAFSCGLCLCSGTKTCSMLFLCYIG